MIPNLPVPTDNIYKFSCLFGLALIVSSMFTFVSIYTSTLDRKVKYMETIIPLESKTGRSKSEEDFLALNKRLVEVSKSNEYTALIVISVALATGLFISWYGANNWRDIIQKRDDALAELQLEKLALEVEKLRRENGLASQENDDG